MKNKKKIQIIIEISEDSPSYNADISKVLGNSLLDREEDLEKLGMKLKPSDSESCWEVSSFGGNDFIRIQIEQIWFEREEDFKLLN